MPLARRKTDSDAEPRRMRILAVDDDHAYLRFLQLLLKRAGFEVTVASDGTAALQKVYEDHDISLVLMDLAMPGMDGIETVGQLRARADPSLYVVLLTAYADPDTSAGSGKRSR